LLVAAGTVPIFIQRAGVDFCGRQTGHHKAWIGPFGELLGFADDAALTAPTLARAVRKILEDTRGLAGLLELLLGFVKFLANRTPQPLILHQTQDETDVVLLAPTHDVFPTPPQADFTQGHRFFQGSSMTPRMSAIQTVDDGRCRLG
jgi:hypothetical protein